MCKNEYQFLHQYIGINVLSYILNLEQNTVKNKPFEEIELNEKQEYVVKDLYSKVVNIRIKNLSEPIFCDLSSRDLVYITNGNDSLFGSYRKHCAGDFPNFESDNDLLSFLVNIAIREYPNLLFCAHRRSRGDHVDIINNWTDSEMCISLVKKDVLDNISNHKDKIEYCLIVNTNNEMYFNYQVCLLPHQLIKRSFYNASNKMNYTIDGFVKEIKNSLNQLRALARNEKIEYSTFVGIRGLVIDSADSLDLGISHIRQFDNELNPSIMTNKIVCRHSYVEKKYISGCIMEIKQVVKLEKISDVEPHLSSMSGQKSIEHQDYILDVFNSGLILSKKFSKATKATMYENGFPLLQVGNFSENNNRQFTEVVFRKEDYEEFIKYSELLMTKDTKYIIGTLKRLQMAVFDRATLEDAMVDTIIAWEGLFGGTFETTFKVTSSICNYIDYYDYAENKEKFLTRLKKLYGIRSKIVHGANPNYEVLSKDYEDAVKIAVDCIRKLLEDDDLLVRKPEQRVHRLVTRS